jgi:hypothetical protein
LPIAGGLGFLRNAFAETVQTQPQQRYPPGSNEAIASQGLDNGGRGGPVSHNLADLTDKGINVVIPLATFLELYTLVGGETPRLGGLKAADSFGNTAGHSHSDGDGLIHVHRH